jgi:hypothetical protein
MTKLKLGDQARDPISGFEGTVTGRAEYLYGCVQVLLSGSDDGKPIGEWFDEDRVTQAKSEGRRGGPQALAPSRN